MQDQEITSADLDALASFDTPTICNALEHLDKTLQGQGYTTRPFVCGFPQQKPIKQGLTPEQLVTNEFVDPSIGLPAP